MEFIRTTKVNLNKEEKNAIDMVLRIIDDMWEQSGEDEMEELWKQYGSNEEGWTCVEDTLRNLLYRSE